MLTQLEFIKGFSENYFENENRGGPYSVHMKKKKHESKPVIKKLEITEKPFRLIRHENLRQQNASVLNTN